MQNRHCLVIAVVALACAFAQANALPDIYLLTVDTLRADRLGHYGCELDTSPNLDALASRSLVFDDFVCEVPLTAPSFGAMMTSRYPRVNGNVRNGMPLPDEVPLLAELLKAKGYQTFCVQSNWTLKDELSRMGRGFDVYDDGFKKKRWGLLVAERPGEDVTEAALALLDERDPAKPLFFWIHWSDPHAPYTKHAKFNPAKGTVKRGDRVSQTRARYDSEVAFTDYCMGRVLDRLPRENAFLIFLADHGESLYEHGYVGHGRRIYQNNLRIPLVIAGPGVTPGRSAVPARGIDIAPTILGLIDVPRVPGMLGVDLLKQPPAPDRLRVVETYGGAVVRIPGAKQMMSDQPPMLMGVLHREWKLILDGDSPELYNLQSDPGELQDLADTADQRVEMLKAAIDEFESAFPRRESNEAALSEDDIEALKSQGYLD